MTKPLPVDQTTCPHETYGVSGYGVLLTDDMLRQINTFTGYLPDEEFNPAQDLDVSEMMHDLEPHLLSLCHHLMAGDLMYHDAEQFRFYISIDIKEALEYNIKIVEYIQRQLKHLGIEVHKRDVKLIEDYLIS